MDDAVREYIDRVLRLQNERRHMSLDAGDLEDIARELGLTDADLGAVRNEVEEHQKRAAGFTRHGLIEEAIVELREASVLAPTRSDIALTLAEALTAAHEAGVGDHRTEAQRIALRVLDLDPDCDAAFDIVARLRKPSRPRFDPKPQRGALPTTMVGEVVAVLPWKSEHSVYDDSAYYSFVGWFRNVSEDEELVEMDTLVVLTRSNDTFEIDNRYVLTSVTPPVRPGETFTHTTTVAVPRDPVWSAEYFVSRLETRPAPPSYAPSKPMTLEWDVPKPSDTEFVVHERAQSHGHGRFRVTLEVSNAGEQAVDNLTLNVQVSAAGARLGERAVQISGASTPPFLVGERRAVEAFIDTARPPDAVRVSVSEVR